jgi:hypothetical protein
MALGDLSGQRREHPRVPGHRLSKRRIGERGKYAERDRRRQCQPQHVPAEHGDEDRRSGREGEHRAIGEVGAMQNAVGERVAESQQRVERADVQAVQHLLQEIEHAIRRFRTGRELVPPASLTCQMNFTS